MPRQPRRTQMDVAKCHTCHAKRSWMSPSATPATQSQCHQCHACHAEVDVAKCHTCHAKRRWMFKCHACHTKLGGGHRQPSAPQRAQARHQSQPSAISATSATQNEGECDQVPHWVPPPSYISYKSRNLIYNIG